MIGTSIGRYQILEELGHGGMSVVYKGFDEDLERDVAVKVLHAHLAKKQENRLRLHREAKAIARLRHENILEVYDYARQDAERAYIVMEYVDGKNLKQFLEDEALPPPPAEYCALIGLKLCQALAHAHEEGIIHRDLKPENVMVSSAGVLKLMDFGIAHVFDAETMTQTGSLLGSPAHMAPEMIEGERVDSRADVFALGTVLYWLATGSLPFEGKNAPQILKRVLEGLYKNPEVVEPRVGQCFSDIIRRCMSYDIDERYASVLAVADDLTRFLDAAPFEDFERELLQYFLHPDAAQETFERELTAHLQRRAKRALEQGDHPTAFRLFNRILAYEPDNALVHAQLERLQNRHAPLKWIGAAAIIIAIAGATYAASTIGSADARHAKISNNNTTPETSSAALDVARDSASRRARTIASRAPDRARSFVATLRTERVAREEALGLKSRAERHATGLYARSLKPSDFIAAKLRRPDNTKRDPTPDETTEPTGADMGSEQDMGAIAVVEPERDVYKFRLQPTSAALVIDGKRYPGLVLGSKGVELERGRRYRIRGECDGCVPHVRYFDTSAPPPQEPEPIVLAWKDGKVKIKANKRVAVYSGTSTRMLATLESGQLWTYDVKFKGPTVRKKSLTFIVREMSDLQTYEKIDVVIKPGATETFNVKL